MAESTMPRLSIGAHGRVSDQVFETLRAAILNGDLPEGFRLRIRDLAQELGTSAMPVREAIRRLDEIGLAQTAPYRGAVVRRFTSAQLLDIYSVRRLLEWEAARLGAGLADAATVELLEEHFARLQQAVDEQRPIDYLDHDEALLATLYRAGGNPVLVDSIQALWVHCRSFKIVGARRELREGAPVNLTSFQRGLIDAAAAADGPAAQRLTDESLDAAIARIRAALHD